jgi:hypothetical protein
MKRQAGRYVFQIAFWLTLLLVVGAAAQMWLFSEERDCQNYCAAEGKQADYHSPKVRSGIRFGRRTPAKAGECQCKELEP